MTRFANVLALSTLLASLVIAACGDSKETPPPADTTADTTPEDTSSPDVADDTVEPTDTVADTTPPADTTIVDPGKGLCIGLVDLCTSQCEDATCFEKCITDEASDESEATLATAYVECVVENECVTGSDPDQAAIRTGYQCEQTNCLGARGACEQGTTAGTGVCTPIGGCIKDCQLDDFACYRGCFADASTTAATVYLNLQYCVSVNCYVQGGVPADFQVCGQNAIEEDGPCAQARTACYGDTPGLQGIEFRPVYGSVPPNPWPR